MELISIATNTIVIGLVFLEFVQSNIFKNWNYCPLQSEAIHLVPKVSFDECLKQCSARNHCQLICYRTRLKLCEIHAAKDKKSSCKSCLSVVRDDILTEKFGSECGCDEGQTCDAPSGSCDYTECGKLPDPFLEINGNLAYVEAKKIAGCKKSFKGNSTIAICGTEGQWKNMPTCDMCPTDGIINVTDSFRIKVYKRAVSQQEANDNCKQACGLLAKMDQTNKMATISSMLISSSEFTNNGYWVDGYSTDPKNPNSWKFSDGVQMPMEKGVFWPSHAPNHNTQPACTRLSKESDYLMDDTGCNSVFPFICELQ